MFISELSYDLTLTSQVADLPMVTDASAGLFRTYAVSVCDRLWGQVHEDGAMCGASHSEIVSTDRGMYV